MTGNDLSQRTACDGNLSRDARWARAEKTSGKKDQLEDWHAKGASPLKEAPVPPPVASTAPGTRPPPPPSSRRGTDRAGRRAAGRRAAWLGPPSLSRTGASPPRSARPPRSRAAVGSRPVPPAQPFPEGASGRFLTTCTSLTCLVSAAPARRCFRNTQLVAEGTFLQGVAEHAGGTPCRWLWETLTRRAGMAAHVSPPCPHRAPAVPAALSAETWRLVQSESTTGTR